MCSIREHLCIISVITVLLLRVASPIFISVEGVHGTHHLDDRMEIKRLGFGVFFLFHIGDPVNCLKTIQLICLLIQMQINTHVHVKEEREGKMRRQSGKKEIYEALLCNKQGGSYHK